MKTTITVNEVPANGLRLVEEASVRVNDGAA